MFVATPAEFRFARTRSCSALIFFIYFSFQGKYIIPANYSAKLIYTSLYIYGIYNFSNEGHCSWYDFAQKIFEFSNSKINLQPIATSGYPTSAKRPVYSVLDKSKIKNTFNLQIKTWQESLITVILPI